MDEKDLAPASHEGSDISGGFIAIGFASTVLGIIFLALLAWALYPDAMIDRTMNLPLPSFPEPRLQIRSGGGLDGLSPARIDPLEQRRLDRSGQRRSAYSNRCRDAKDRTRRHRRLAGHRPRPSLLRHQRRMRMKPLLTLLALLLLNSFPAYAQRTPDITGVAYKQKLGARLPLESAFTDADGQDVRIGDVFNRAPVILVLGYFHCDKLCGVTRLALLRAAQKAGLSAGSDYVFVAISIDPTENDRRRTTGARDRFRRGVANRRGRGIPLSYRNAGEHSRRSRGCRISLSQRRASADLHSSDRRRCRYGARSRLQLISPPLAPLTKKYAARSKPPRRRILRRAHPRRFCSASISIRRPADTHSRS